MKNQRTMQFMTALTLFLSTFLLPIHPLSVANASTSVTSSSSSSHGVVWSSDVQTVYRPASGGVWYPRMLKLDQENWLISFDTNEGGGNTRVVVVRTQDSGNSWSTPVNVASEADGNAANGQMLLLPSGDIWLAYRKVVESGGQIHTSLRVKQSSDNGATWSDLPQGDVIVEASAPNYKGVWEPHLEIIQDEIVVLYADDGPNAVGSTNYQNLYMKRWTGSGWSERIVISDGVAAQSRDGMPVITKMADGRYMTIFEASDVPGHPFVIKYKISEDGFNWSSPRQHLYTPIGGGKKAGAPFVATLGDGRLVAAFQTDENSSNTGDPYTSMHTMVGDLNGDNWGHKAHVFQVPSTHAANWNSLMVVDSTHIVAATSSNYPMDSIYIRHGYTAMPAGTNLVSNGSFEHGDIIGWRSYGLDFPERIHLVHNLNSTRQATTYGDYYISLSGTSGPSSAYIGQSISSLNDGTYTLTAQMRGTGGQNVCVMEVKDYGGDISSVPCPAGEEWTTVTVDNIQVSSGTATIGFFVANSSDEQWVDIDDVRFSSTVEPSAPNEPGEQIEPQPTPPTGPIDGDTTDPADKESDAEQDNEVKNDTSNSTEASESAETSELTEASEQQQIVFKDVPAGHWAETAIKLAVALNIVKGYPEQLFKPNVPTTRAQFMVMLANALKWEHETAQLTFNDSEQIGAWSADAIARGIQLGVINGYADGSFRPNQEITRLEMAVMLDRALKASHDSLLNASTDSTDSTDSPDSIESIIGDSTELIWENTIEYTSFADDASIPSWGKPAVESLRTLNIINGRSNNVFAPNETATRAEALVILMRVINKR